MFQWWLIRVNGSSSLWQIMHKLELCTQVFCRKINIIPISLSSVLCMWREGDRRSLTLVVSYHHHLHNQLCLLECWQISSIHVWISDTSPGDCKRKLWHSIGQARKIFTLLTIPWIISQFIFAESTIALSSTRDFAKAKQPMDRLSWRGEPEGLHWVNLCTTLTCSVIPTVYSLSSDPTRRHSLPHHQTQPYSHHTVRRLRPQHVR